MPLGCPRPPGRPTSGSPCSPPHARAHFTAPKGRSGRSIPSLAFRQEARLAFLKPHLPLARPVSRSPVSDSPHRPPCLVFLPAPGSPFVPVPDARGRASGPRNNRRSQASASSPLPGPPHAHTVPTRRRMPPPPVLSLSLSLARSLARPLARSQVLSNVIPPSSKSTVTMIRVLRSADTAPPRGCPCAWPESDPQCPRKIRGDRLWLFP